MNITYSIGHSGSNYYHRTNIKTLSGAKIIARRDINQSLDGRIVIRQHCEDYASEVVAVLYGYDKRWTNI